MRLADWACKVKHTAFEAFTSEERKEGHSKLKAAKVTYPWIQQKFMTEKEIQPKVLLVESSLESPMM